MSTIYLEGEEDDFGRTPLSPEHDDLAEFNRLLPQHEYGLSTSCDAATSALSRAIRCELRYARDSMAKMKAAKDNLADYEKLCIEIETAISKTAERTSQLIVMLEKHQAGVKAS